MPVTINGQTPKTERASTVQLDWKRIAGIAQIWADIVVIICQSWRRKRRLRWKGFAGIFMADFTRVRYRFNWLDKLVIYVLVISILLKYRRVLAAVHFSRCGRSNGFRAQAVRALKGAGLNFFDGRRPSAASLLFVEFVGLKWWIFAIYADFWRSINWLNASSNRPTMKEMVGGCCVCSDERGWDENPLVYCDGHGCNVAVHQGTI